MPWRIALRRDQRAFRSAFTGSRSALSPLSTTPVPLRYKRARHERKSSSGSNSRRASVCGSAAGHSAPATFR